MRRLFLVTIVVTSLMSIRPRRAEAFAFEDVSAFLQRNAHYIIQFHQMLSAAKDARSTLMKAYAGLKDWKNLGWKDTLDLVHAPWFDGIDGIDDIREASDLTILNAEEAQKVFKDVADWNSFETNPRYQRDRWFREKVNSVRSISRRARAHRAAILRQMRAQNHALSEDIKKIKSLRDEIESESKKSPMNQGLVTTLEGELAAVQAKYQGEQLMLVNQRAIMTLVGEENVDESFDDAAETEWLGDNRRAFDDFGAGFAR